MNQSPDEATGDAMRLRVVPDGADGYQLLSPDHGVVGWARGRAIGVGGFHDEAAAILSAVRSYRVLAAWLARQRLPTLPVISDEPPHLVHDGAHRWLVIGRTLVARVRVEASRLVDPPSQAFEIVLRGALNEGMAIHAALVVARAARGAIAAADIAWAPRRHGLHAAPTPFTHLELDG